MFAITNLSKNHGKTFIQQINIWEAAEWLEDIQQLQCVGGITVGGNHENARRHWRQPSQNMLHKWLR